MAICGVTAALGLAGPMPASAAGSSAACKGAKHKLARDEAHHAPPPVIKQDKARVRRYCHHG